MTASRYMNGSGVGGTSLRSGTSDRAAVSAQSWRPANQGFCPSLRGHEFHIGPVEAKGSPAYEDPVCCMTRLQKVFLANVQFRGRLSCDKSESPWPF